jgi:hypothetical protein
MRIYMRRLVVLLGVIGVSAIATAPAQAGTLSDTATSCQNRTLERPFTRWLDPLKYVLAPNGGFESGTKQWTITGGAYVVSGNESWRVHSSTDSRSLYLPSGSSATTRAVCVETLDLVARFFALNRGGLLSLLKVDAVFETPLGETVVVPAGVVAGSGKWQPTLPMLAVGNLTSVLNANGEAAVAFRFTPIGLGARWQIDDVYVDPLKNG